MRQIDNRTHYEICELFKWANKTLEEKHPEPSSLRNMGSPDGRTRIWKAPAAAQAQGSLDFNNTDWINGVLDEKSF
jgi:hypothetical protein